MTIDTVRKKEAEEKNKKTYIGKICKHCSGRKRFVHTGRCVDYGKHSRNFDRAREVEADPKRIEARRFDQIFRKYGVDKDEWYWMLKEQDHRCKICRKVMSNEWALDKRKGRHRTEIFVDHNHRTGRVRGLLCHSCNTVIGHAKDDVSILNSAIVYLKECV